MIVDARIYLMVIKECFGSQWKDLNWQKKVVCKTKAFILQRGDSAVFVFLILFDVHDSSY